MSAIISALIFSASQVAVNNIFTDFVNSLEETAPNSNIENQYFSYDNSRMSDNLGFLMKKIKVNSLVIPEHYVSMNSDREILLEMKNVSLSFSFSWEYSINHLSDFGTASVSVKDGGFSTIVQVKDSTLLRFSSKKTKLDLIGMQVLVSRPDGVNQNWLFKMFREEIEDVISELMSGFIEDTINEYNIGSMYYKLDGVDIGFDYSLTESPSISEEWLSFKSKGIFVQDSDRNYNPPIPVPGAVNDEIKEGIQIVISDYLANSLSYSAYVAGLLDLNITNETLPNSFPFELTTTLIGFLIPDLVDTYGLDEPVSLMCSFSDVPLIEFIENQDWSVQLRTNQMAGCVLFVEDEIAFIIEGMFAFEAQVYLEDWKVKGEISTFELREVTVVSSEIDVNGEDVETTVNDVLETYRKSLNDDVLKNGISLTKDQRFDLTSTKIRSGKGYMLAYLEPRVNFVFDQLF